MPPRIWSRDDVTAAAAALQAERLEDALRWCIGTFGDRIAFASSLGLEDQVLTDAIARHRLGIPIFVLDTGRLPSETYDLLAKTEARYGLRFTVYCPQSEALERLVMAQGINGFRDSLEARRACCRVRKLEPLQRALSGRLAWITGLRQEQSSGRRGVQLVEWDEQHGLIKVNPLAQWSAERVRAYAEEFNVPYNPLHDRGYPSIGCACCTRAVEPGEDARAGRWWWERDDRKECGLHFGTSPACGRGEGI